MEDSAEGLIMSHRGGGQSRGRRKVTLKGLRMSRMAVSRTLRHKGPNLVQFFKRNEQQVRVSLLLVGLDGLRPSYEHRRGKGQKGSGSSRAGVPEGLFQGYKTLRSFWTEKQMTMRSSLDAA